MTPQEINNQLELLRLKELFMSDIEVRSKMAMLSCDGAEEKPPFHSFCEYTHCTQEVAKMFSQLMLMELFLTPEERVAERKRLNDINYDTL